MRRYRGIPSLFNELFYHRAPKRPRNTLDAKAVETHRRNRVENNRRHKNEVAGEWKLKVTLKLCTYYIPSSWVARTFSGEPLCAHFQESLQLHDGELTID